MSILIQGMEMPSCCLMCPMYTISGCRASKSIFPDWMNVAAVPKNCPLVPFPEKHGRLIDAEAFVDYIQNIYDNNEITNGDWIVFRLAIKDQPTIVPAERGTDDG